MDIEKDRPIQTSIEIIDETLFEGFKPGVLYDFSVYTNGPTNRVITDLDRIMDLYRHQKSVSHPVKTSLKQYARMLTLDELLSSPIKD